MGLLAVGKTSKLIAYELSISAKTVEIHRARIMAKMGCGSLVELGRLWEAAIGALPASLDAIASEGDRLD
ncbi:Nitrogen regulation protein NR(I) [Azospirillum doebereinerae]